MLQLWLKVKDLQTDAPAAAAPEDDPAQDEHVLSYTAEKLEVEALSYAGWLEVGWEVLMYDTEREEVGGDAG